jgi:phosphopantothenoylcysteine decarboxylase/phosphopantothenate--cysteine ligase
MYLVVPATANVIGKFVYGIADDPVSLCFMSCTGPRFIAPAMNVAMFNSPAVKRNLQTLRSFENTFVMDSPAGELACGEVGKGRLLDPAEIVAYLEATNVVLNNVKDPVKFCITQSPAAQYLQETALQDLPASGERVPRVLITAGRTEEAIDPVRYISNRSSGKTAVAISATFLANGFDVSVVAGPMEAEFPGAVHVTKIKSARDMHKAVLEQMKNADVLVHCAAVADYRPKVAATEKIKDSRSQLVLELEPNPNILRDSVAQKRAGQVIVGFALETDHFKEHAAEKLKKSGADALLLNAPVAANSGFGFDEVRYTLIRANSRNAQNSAEVEIPEMKMGSKIDLAQEIVDFSLDQLKNA